MPSIEVAQAVVDTAVEASSTLQAGIDAAVAGLGSAAQPAKPAPKEQRPSDAASLVASASVSDDAVLRPTARPQDLILASTTPTEDTSQEIVTRLSTSGGHHWGINVGRYGSRYEAEKVLLQMALTEMATLDGTLRKVVQSPRGFDANFLGMTRESADLACRRLQARNVSCFMVGPS